MHHDALDALDVEHGLQVIEEKRLIGHALQNARFARRHLADDGNQNGLALARDRRHPHRHVEIFQRDMTMALAERPFRLEQLGIDQPFDDDFRIGGHLKIDGLAADDADRLANEPAGNAEFVLIDRQFLRTGEEHRRSAADDDGAGHRLAAFLIFEPMQIAAGAAQAACHAHAETVLRLQPGAVSAQVADAAVGITGDA